MDRKRRPPNISSLIALADCCGSRDPRLVQGLKCEADFHPYAVKGHFNPESQYIDQKERGLYISTNEFSSPIPVPGLTSKSGFLFLAKRAEARDGPQLAADQYRKPPSRVAPHPAQQNQRKKKETKAMTFLTSLLRTLHPTRQHNHNRNSHNFDYDYEAYEEMAQRRLSELEAEARQRCP
ncbi:molybdenum cofactor biosynthesis protein MoaE [bacterium]|nr:molybdenum cofactor biosynthesis protein MoaE [bacterium]